MKKPNPQKLQQFDLKSQLIQQANEVSQFFKEHGYAAEFEDDILPSARVDIAPPPKPEKTNFNPDQIVDIVTFIEHPYFCNLRPHPWQKLILKCFYKHLVIIRLIFSVCKVEDINVPLVWRKSIFKLFSD